MHAFQPSDARLKNEAPRKKLATFHFSSNPLHHNSKINSKATWPIL